MSMPGRWRPTGETILFAAAALLLTLPVLGSLDPTGQLRGSFPGTVQGPGLTLDEGFNVDVGVRLADSVLSGDLIEYGRRSGELPDHPPFGRLWLGLAHELALLVFPVGRVEGPYVVGLARTGSAVAFGLTLFLIARIASRLTSDAAVNGAPTAVAPAGLGLLALVVYGTLPRTFAHAHIASLESTVALSWAAVVAWLVCRDDELDRPRVAAGTGFWLGLACLTKVQGILLGPPLAVWIMCRLGRRGLVPLAISLSTAAVVFFAGWPWLWSDPVGRTLAYLGRTTQRSPTLVWYGGRVFEDRDVPALYPWTTFAVSLPVLTLVVMLVGAAAVIAGLRSRRDSAAGESDSPTTERPHYGGRSIGLLTTALFPLGLFTIPGIAVYDGERLFSMVFVVWAVLGAIGIERITRWMGRGATASARAKITTAVLLGSSVGAGGVMGIAATWPCSLTSYGLLAGGPAGAARLGLARTYWGDSLCRELLEQVPVHVPKGATIEILPVMHPFQIPILAAQTPALLSGEYRLIPYNTPRPPGRRFLLVFFRDDYLEPPFRQAVPPGKPLAELRRGGVLLGGLYELEPSAGSAG